MVNISMPKVKAFSEEFGRKEYYKAKENISKPEAQ